MTEGRGIRKSLNVNIVFRKLNKMETLAEKIKLVPKSENYSQVFIVDR